MVKGNPGENRREDRDEGPVGGWPQQPVELISYVVEDRQRTLNFLCIGVPIAIFAGIILVGSAIAVSGILAWILACLGSTCVLGPVSLYIAVGVGHRRDPRLEASARRAPSEAIGQASEDCERAGGDQPGNNPDDAIDGQTGSDADSRRSQS